MRVEKKRSAFNIERALDDQQREHNCKSGDIQLCGWGLLDEVRVGVGVGVH